MSRMFPLAGLLRLRNLQEEQAAAELALANADRRRAQRRRRETAEALAGTTLPQYGDDLTWRAAIAARAAMTGLVAESTAAHRVAEARVADATAEWSAAKTLATGLTKLEGRHDEAVRLEDERDEQKVLDEAASRARTTQGADGAATPGPTGEGDR